MAFVDRAEVIFKAGDGGDGVTSFHHEKFRQKGGPDGGDGGHGGNIILIASYNQNTLAAFRYKKNIHAPNGKPGLKSKKHGRSGQDLKLALPVGTVVLNKAGDILADLLSDGQREVIAKGGKGGFGNAHFTSSTRQAPRVAEKGETGQHLEAVMELKMIADVGIIGLPNAGKSTLLSVISNAHPEIADYPFTTLVPNLGVVDIDESNSLLFADIPGLIAGASEGKGLGDEFLRHIERTNLLLHLIDAYSEDIAKDYKTIIKELKAYKVDLSGRAQIVALTKIEGFDKKSLQKQLARLKKVVPASSKIFVTSSLSGEGLKDLLREILKIVQKVRKAARTAEEPSLPVIVPIGEDDSWQITKTDQGFAVIGKKIERFATRTKFGDYHGEQRLRDILAKEGVLSELEKQNIEPGQKIIFGDPQIGEVEY